MGRVGGKGGVGEGNGRVGTGNPEESLHYSGREHGARGGGRARSVDRPYPTRRANDHLILTT
eukprot:scaffold159144_cov25-Tisochrysis_lutea.AAC.6